jgi:hypothetical protein
MLQRARSLYVDLGRTPALHATCSPIEAAIKQMRGDLEGAAHVLRRSCGELHGAHRPFYLATQAAELSEILVRLGCNDEAETWLGIAEIHAPAEDVISHVWLEIARARRLAAGDDVSGAIEAARTAVSSAGATDALNLRAYAHTTLSDTLERAGLAPEAGVELAAAAALFNEKENTAAADNLSRRVAATQLRSAS